MPETKKNKEVRIRIKIEEKTEVEYERTRRREEKSVYSKIRFIQYYGNILSIHFLQSTNGIRLFK